VPESASCALDVFHRRIRAMPAVLRTATLANVFLGILIPVFTILAGLGYAEETLAFRWHTLDETLDGPDVWRTGAGFAAFATAAIMFAVGVAIATHVLEPHRAPGRARAPGAAVRGRPPGSRRARSALLESGLRFPVRRLGGPRRRVPLRLQVGS
jgi:hypothetical protein